MRIDYLQSIFSSFLNLLATENLNPTTNDYKED